MSLDLNDLLPATYRTEVGELIAADQYLIPGIERELDLHRLASIHSWLWFAGLPMPPRPLHHQVLIGREIVITERLDLHLIWTTGRLFLKPIPRYLLEPSCWTEYLCCAENCNCTYDEAPNGPTPTNLCCRRSLRQRALGFLYSYAALISHESDVRLAQEKHLLPPEVQWHSWRTLVGQLDLEHIHSQIDPRFLHGELRLSRLNVLYSILETPFRGYMSHWNQYGIFIRDNFAWLASGTVYIAIVLTAMQVGLATESLAHSSSFQSASYGFTVFSILGPLIVATLILLLFCCIFLWNVGRALRFRSRRLAKLRSQE